MSRFGSLGTQYFDDAGDPLINGYIYFYESGTTTPKTTYADVNLTIPNANPVQLTAAGRQPNVFFDGSAKAVLTKSDYVQVEVRDPVGDDVIGGTTAWISTVIYDQYEHARGTNGYDYVSLAGGNIGNDPVSSPEYWTKIIEVKVWNTNETYAADDVVLGTDGMLYTSLVSSNSANNPTTDDLTKWQPVYDSTNVGDVVFTGDLSRYKQPSWLECTGNAYNSTTYALLYAKIGGAYVKLSDPSTLPASNGRGCAINNVNSLVSFATLSSPYIQNYTLISDVLTKITNPATLPTGAANKCNYNHNGTLMAVAHVNSPYVTIYSVSGTTFTKLANPAVLPVGTANDVAFNNDGTLMAVAQNASPFITVYNITAGPTFTKIANPATLPASTAYGVAFSADGSLLFVAHSSSPYVTIYSVSGTTLNKRANPATLPTGNATDVAISADGSYVAVAHTITPFITIYSNDAGNLTKIDDPAILPPSTANSVSFNAASNRLMVTNTTPPESIITYRIIDGVFVKVYSPQLSTSGYDGSFSADDVYMINAQNSSSVGTVHKLTPVLPDIDLAATPDVKAYIKTGL